MIDLAARNHRFRPFKGDRGFESTFLQRRVECELGTRNRRGRIVKRERLIKVSQAFRDVPRRHYPHHAMPNHQRDCRPLLLRERQELRREIAMDIAIECHKVHGKEGVEDQEQQQRVFGRLSQCY